MPAVTKTTFRNFLREHRIIILLFLLGLLFRLLITGADNFLHPWDERFHALVARNIMNDPFTPKLRANPVTNNFDINRWCCNEIWLLNNPCSCGKWPSV